MSLNIVAFDPMLRAMGLGPSLSRYSPETKFKPLKTLLLSKTPLVGSLNVTFDDSCFVTVPAEGEVPWDQIKLVAHGPRKVFSQIYLGLFGQAQNLTLALADDGAKVVIGAGALVRGQIQCFGRPSVFIGDRSTLHGPRLMIGQADLVIGDNCLIHEDVLIQAMDPHPIVDLNTGEILNTGRRELRLGSHVLVGRCSQILANTSIGDGSVVAPGSTVEGKFGKHVWLAGVPAIVKREQISWARGFGQEAPNFNTKAKK